MATATFAVIGDLGGTNCRLELLAFQAGAPPTLRPAPRHTAKYGSSSAGSLTELVQRFVAEEAAKEALGASSVALFSIAVCG